VRIFSHYRLIYVVHIFPHDPTGDDVNEFDPGSMYAQSGAIPLVTIKLKPKETIQRPTNATVASNHIRHIMGAMPTFVEEFEKKLSETRTVALDHVSLAALSLVS
jgi:hypothetical protein